VTTTDLADAEIGENIAHNFALNGLPPCHHLPHTYAHLTPIHHPSSRNLSSLNLRVGVDDCDLVVWFVDGGRNWIYLRITFEHMAHLTFCWLGNHFQ
jgi:hypothetical protein